MIPLTGGTRIVRSRERGQWRGQAWGGAGADGVVLQRVQILSLWNEKVKGTRGSGCIP